MLKKIVIKIFGLVFLLALVTLAIRRLSEPHVKNEMIQNFLGEAKTLSWCPDHVAKITWFDQSVSKNFKKKWYSASIPKQIKYFCSIPYDQEAKLENEAFKTLLQVQSAEGRNATLEWNPDIQLFRTEGIAFKSSELSRELLDEVH